jgi:predicted oxidoreductase
MKTRTIGRSSLITTRLAYGCWRLMGTWNPREVTPERIEHGKKAIIAAYEAGYTMFDHADVYCWGICEQVFGDVLRSGAIKRDRFLVATKCGVRFATDPTPASPARYDFSAEHILSSCENSLKRLGIETVDLYQLHRPDYLMNPEEVAGAFDQLRRQGKVREFGVSNFTPSQLALLAKFLPMPLIVNQVQIQLADLHCFDDGTLDQCIADRITPLAWSPLGGGFLGTGGTVDEKHPRRALMLKLVELMDRLATEYGVSRSVIAMAWLMKHPSGIVPIVGSKQPERITEALKADEIELTREHWYELLEAARGAKVP